MWGRGSICRFASLAEKIRDVVNPEATLVWDRTKPDGTPRKVLDVSKLTNLGWSPRYDLDAGIRSTYDWFLAQGAPTANCGESTRPSAPEREGRGPIAP